MTEIANSHRGEVSLTFAGRRYVMRPTWQAMVEIEAEIGERLLPLAVRIGRQDVGLRDLAVIVTAGLKASGEPAKFDAIAGMIAQEGVLKVLPIAVEFLHSALTGGKELDEGEAKPAEGPAMMPSTTAA